MTEWREGDTGTDQHDHGDEGAAGVKAESAVTDHADLAVVTWSHYGGIYAFGAMMGCLMALPLFIAVFNLLLAKIDVAKVSFIAWVTVSMASLVLFVLTVATLWNEQAFVRRPSATTGELRGTRAAMAVFETNDVLSLLRRRGVRATSVCGRGRGMLRSSMFA